MNNSSIPPIDFGPDFWWIYLIGALVTGLIVFTKREEEKPNLGFHTCAALFFVCCSMLVLFGSIKVFVFSPALFRILFFAVVFFVFLRKILSSLGWMNNLKSR